MKNQIAISELRQLMLDVCASKGLSTADAALVIENYLEAELSGKDTHGVGKFVFESKFFEERIAKPEILLDTGPLVKIDGNKEIGPVAANYAVELAASRAKEYGIAIVAVHNIQRYGILRTWIRKFEARKVFGIVMNTCEPAMAGHGGHKKVLGTNPLAFGLATEQAAYITDMATSEVAMTTIWKSLRQGTQLPPGAFYDADGKITRDPSEAKAVKNFGGVKGYSLALLIQIMSGPLFGFKTASAIKNMYDIGYIFLAIDPETTTSYEDFLRANTQLAAELQEGGAMIPGSRSLQNRQGKTVHIETALLEELERIRKQQ